MTTKRASPGRPTGTCIDDHKQLLRIAALMAADPDLKPTTAIRSLGIEEPSVIRRLRDKFREQRADLLVEAQRAAITETTLVCTELENVSDAPVTMATETPKHDTLSSKSPWSPSPETYFSAWCDMSLSAISTTVTNQALATEHWLRLPPVSLAVKGQMLVNALALSAFARSPFGRPGFREKFA